MRLIVLLLLASLGACSTVQKLKFWEPEYEFQAQSLPLKELRRALICNTPTEEARVQLFDSLASLVASPAGQALQVGTMELSETASYLVVEQGLRRSGGYSIELRKKAQVDEAGQLQLKADWLEPAPERMRIQILTSLCVLAEVAPQPYKRVSLVDSDGKERASWVRPED